mgnify:CR=1 FL=1
MVFFDRLFSAYYFLLLKLRQLVIVKSRIEDFQAMSLVLISQILTISVCTSLLKRRKIIGDIGLTKPIVIVFVLIFFYIGYKYFLSNQKRKTKIIDEYRNLSRAEKVIWEIISIGFILGPLLIVWTVF